MVPYALNFIGAGLCRFTSGLSSTVAILGLASAFWAFLWVRPRRESLPWLGLLLFAVVASIVAAMGRAGAFGIEQAYITRYVSFSSMFWLGWTGLMACTWQTLPHVTRLARAGVALAALLAVANGQHMTKKAYEVGERTRVLAQTIGARYPRLDRTLLDEIYCGHLDVALDYLGILRRLGFPPFEKKGRRRSAACTTGVAGSPRAGDAKLIRTLRREPPP